MDVEPLKRIVDDMKKMKQQKQEKKEEKEEKDKKESNQINKEPKQTDSMAEKVENKKTRTAYESLTNQLFNMHGDHSKLISEIRNRNAVAVQQLLEHIEK